MPSQLHGWLTDAGSLTARIVARCEVFRVHVIGERRTRPGRDERTRIDLPAGRHAWVREVLLIADGRPVVFAHSILALPDLTGAWHMARAIGSRPLGAALFADPAILREPLACARLQQGHPLLLQACRVAALDAAGLWARRSRFLRAGRPLLVTEVFLPAITALRQ